MFPEIWFRAIALYLDLIYSYFGVINMHDFDTLKEFWQDEGRRQERNRANVERADVVRRLRLRDFSDEEIASILNMLLEEVNQIPQGLLYHKFDISIAKQVWQEEAYEDGKIQYKIDIAARAIKIQNLTLSDAMSFAGLDVEHRDILVERLQEQDVKYEL